jgi:hypothetical protein
MPVTLARHESALGTWTSAQWKPARGTALYGALDRIWYFDGVLAARRERVFPDGLIELIVQLDEPHRPGDDPGRGSFPPLCATGLRLGSETVQAPPGRCRVVGLMFSPPAAFTILRESLAALTSLTVDLHDLVGPGAAELANRLEQARAPIEALSIAARWASDRLARETTALEPAVLRLHAQLRAGTGWLQEPELGSGRRRAAFNASFRHAVGTTPKRFARIVRFRRALEALAAGSRSLDEVALACGYYDQAHFSNEFREHAGLTPGDYVRSISFPNGMSLAQP